MNEYITKEAALKAVTEADLHERMCFVAGEVKQKIRKIPAADVAPVVHGWWIEEDGCQICSNCGEEHSWDEYRASFCECCGAKMDLEVDL